MTSFCLALIAQGGIEPSAESGQAKQKRMTSTSSNGRFNFRLVLRFHLTRPGGSGKQVDVSTNTKTGHDILMRVLYHLTGIACGEAVQRIYDLLRGME